MSDVPVIAVDEKCLDLAFHFLKEEKEIIGVIDAWQLAAEIQVCIEDYLKRLKAERDAQYAATASNTSTTVR